MAFPLKLLIVAALAAGTAFALRFMMVRSDGGGIEGRWKIVTLPDGWKPLPGTQVIVTEFVSVKFPPPFSTIRSIRRREPSMPPEKPTAGRKCGWLAIAGKAIPSP
jgi:hypothetical protein